jgi:hypothetical protein
VFEERSVNFVCRTWFSVGFECGELRLHFTLERCFLGKPISGVFECPSLVMISYTKSLCFRRGKSLRRFEMMINGEGLIHSSELQKRGELLHLSLCLEPAFIPGYEIVPDESFEVTKSIGALWLEFRSPIQPPHKRS